MMSNSKIKTPFRTYSKQKKKIEPPQTLTQLITGDDSLFLEVIELENLQSNSESRKRKSDEALPEVSSNVKKENLPNPPKRPRSLEEDITNFTQKFLLDCSLTPTQLTQSSDCITKIDKEDGFSAAIVNPVTCSQYVERLPENDSFSLNDDTIDELFKVDLTESAADLNKSIVVDDKKEILGKDDGFLNHTIRHLLPVSSSPFVELGPFFGLTNHHKKVIFKAKNIQSLYDWQEECLRLKAIHNKTNLIYALPTSGGKTLVAEIAMLREIILGKRNVIFVLPYVSIVQEKVQDLMPFAMEFNFIVEEYCAGKGSIPPIKRRKKNAIYVCTMEKSQILFDSLHENKRLQEVGLIVVDELHMVGDAQRGYNLETLLAKATFNRQSHIQVIGMSATISNLHQIASFLKADIYTRDFRPVELKEYVKIGSEILSIESKSLSEAFKLERRIGDDYSSKMLKRDSDHITALVLEIIPKSSCLIFCATKQNCENVATLLSDLLPLELKNYKRDDKINLIAAIKADSNGQICSVLAKTIPFGVVYHHSGLTSDERRHIEEAYRLNILCVICCTSTLAAGVNLPAQRVIIRSPYVGNQFLTLTRYKQMVGRAGRAGKCETGESIMMCDIRDHNKLTTLLCSKMDETQSGFLQDEYGQLLQTVIMNLIGTKIAQSIDDLVQFFKCSLFFVQLQRDLELLREKITTSVKVLMEEGALTFEKAKSGNRYSSFKIMIDGINEEVYPDDKLEVSKLGNAAVNAGISLEEAKLVQQDLRKLNENFVISQHLHILFIVVPLDCLASIHIDSKHFNEIFMQLNPSLLNTAKVVGITENLAMKLITRPTAVRKSEKEIIKRFFVALMLYDLSNSKNAYEVARTYKINRGMANNLLNSASSRCYSIFKFCEMHEEFLIFKDVLEKFTKRLAYCCSDELLPLMELPSVKIGRAKMLYAAGLKKPEDIAKLNPREMVDLVKHVNLRQAEQIIRAAKISIVETIENYQERLEELKVAVRPVQNKSR